MFFLFVKLVVKCYILLVFAFPVSGSLDRLSKVLALVLPLLCLLDNGGMRIFHNEQFSFESHRVGLSLVDDG